MNNKAQAVNNIHRAIGFIEAVTEGHAGRNVIYGLKSLAESIENESQNEEYHAYWLTLLNTLHAIDPDWEQKYKSGDVCGNACQFITDLAKEFKVASAKLGEMKNFCVGVDFAAFTNDQTAHLIASIKPDCRHHVCEGVYFHDLLHSVAIAQVKEELEKAEKKHPAWPTDAVHAAAILGEEAGELIKAAIDYHYHGGSLEDVRIEAAQVGAMAIRVLGGLPYAERPKASEVTGNA
ncbi:hypothetical protein FS595_09065 [Serratia rubidaea]|uniref:hypothetical protein n=1 Tax=Serratia rubidaea TaxID=61652 RepID=UPI001F4662E2|nr:hypothetical protein [Serratia rubidaea]UJD79840.1 hypothetical protein FS596_09065 [Serratia rubidaea]UJD84396.1 hypothetical protein FS595_09065 [Serratia rubidaea]